MSPPIPSCKTRGEARLGEAIGRLAGGIAHDFNNVLSAILSYADLLGDDLGAVVHHGILERGTAFLQKPFSAAVLARKVREVLDSSESRIS